MLGGFVEFLQAGQVSGFLSDAGEKIAERKLAAVGAGFGEFNLPRGLGDPQVDFLEFLLRHGVWFGAVRPRGRTATRELDLVHEIVVRDGLAAGLRW